MNLISFSQYVHHSSAKPCASYAAGIHLCGALINPERQLPSLSVESEQNFI